MPPATWRKRREVGMTSAPDRTDNVIGGNPTISGAVVQARSVTGGVHVYQPLPTALPLPRQLPATPQSWVDRRTELDVLVRACAGVAPGTVRCVAINGPGGIGKSALAVRLLRRLGAAAGDAQLYADLRGLPGQKSRQPAAVLAQFLRAFGFGLSSPLPTAVEELAGWWRSVTATRRVAVLVDNADDDQIRPLFPGGEGSLLVATSRKPLTGLLLDGATAHELQPLSPDAAVELLTLCAGPDHLGRDTPAALHLASQCAYAPLALRTAAARLRTQPVTALAEPARPSAAAGAPSSQHPGIQGAIVTNIDQAYQALPQQAAAAYRRLGALAAGTFDLDAVAAVCAVVPAQSQQLVDVLEDSNLVRDLRTDNERAHSATWYGDFYDPVRDHATDVAATEPPQLRQEAVRRWLEWLLHMATAAEARLSPSHRTLPRSYHYPQPASAPFTNEDDTVVLGWLDRHRSDLLTAVRVAFDAGWYTLCWQLADAMQPLHFRRRLVEDCITVHEDYALPAAERDGNRHVVRRSLTTLGWALHNVGRDDQALERYQQALDSARGEKHVDEQVLRDQAQALHGIGDIHWQAGHASQAIPPLHEALEIREDIGYVRGAALTRLLLGDIAAGKSDWDTAIAYMQRARRDLLAVEDPHDAARALAMLGRTHSSCGRHAKGEALLYRAEREFAKTGSLHWQARTREWLGETAENHGDTGQARQRYAAARETYANMLSARDIERLNQRLNSLETQPPATP